MKQVLTRFFGLLMCMPVLYAEILHAQSKSDCLACHSDSSLTMERAGKQVSLTVNEIALNHSPHRKLVCVACHVGFDPQNVPHKEKITPVNCLACHKDAPLKHSFHPQLSRAIAANQEPDIGCKDCHGTHEIVSPKVPGSKFSEEKTVETCGDCHADVKENYLASSHGTAFVARTKGAPTCLTCHRSAITQGSGRDTLSQKTAQAKLCVSCHLDNQDVRNVMSPTAGFIQDYAYSVHGQALQHGNTKAANCVSCHGNHEMRKGSDPLSFVNRNNIPSTCGRCHAGVEKQFAESIHGAALKKGVMEAPVCTNCHGEHSILAPSNPKSSVAPLNVSGQVCSPCHSSVRLSEKFGIQSNRFKTFSDSNHGLATQQGSVEVANCASCHGVHNIKSSDDSTSTVFKGNLALTCGKCHSGANERFTMGKVHVSVATQDQPVLYWIARFYLILIVTTIGMMGIHNILDFVKKARRKLRIRRGMLPEESVGHGLYVRMTLSERLQHGSLIVSFTTLVITGFMLRYPEADWVLLIRRLSEHVFILRGVFHRIAAVVMVAAGLYHLYYISFTVRGRQLLYDLLPRLQDARDAAAVMKYNLRLSNQKPRFGRFSYIEKSEYWALIWGTVVMAATGVMMWFDNTFMGLFTKLGYDIARTVHFYEAWLATLSIVVWHFYFVIFNPDTYPVNLAFWKGTITEEEMEEEHPLELEDIRCREMEREISEKGKDEKAADPKPVHQ
jgi:cytochrome b subunit of formate dehydrogenase